MHPAAASLAVPQPVVYRIAEACPNRRDPIDFCSGREGCGVNGAWDWDGHRTSVRPDVRSIEHPLDAENPVGRDLPVIADLTAADKPGPGVAEARTREIIGDSTALPRTTHVATDIESGPIIDGDRRRSRWCFPYRQVRSEHTPWRHQKSRRRRSV